MRNTIHVSVERHHKVFLSLTESLNASGIHREAVEGKMVDRGIEPAELKSAINKIESASGADLESIMEEESTAEGLIEASERVQKA